jgi:uncharacterized membrane protein HdeD (DUF308 family)
MFSKSFFTIVTGLISMIIACVIFYFETRSVAAFILFGVGFVMVGIGILMGFFKMVSEDNHKANDS